MVCAAVVGFNPPINLSLVVGLLRALDILSRHITLPYVQSVLTLRLDSELGDLLEQVCSRDGRARGNVVRDAHQ